MFYRIPVNLYVTGDLAFYAMIMGKEGMSGNWCHLCQLSRAEFSDLLKDGNPWSWELYREIAAQVESSPNNKPRLGVKTAPWWDFIPLEHYVVPLLHCLIGIGNDILSLFRDIVSESIDYISPEEIQTRSLKSKVEETIVLLTEERDTWDASTSGVELKRLQNKLRSQKRALLKLTKKTALEDSDPQVNDGSLVDIDEDEIMTHINNGVMAMDCSNESDSDSEEELTVDNNVSGQSLRAKTAAKRKEIKDTKKSL